jgi:hypothetical protein
MCKTLLAQAANFDVLRLGCFRSPLRGGRVIELIGGLSERVSTCQTDTCRTPSGSIELNTELALL